MFTRGDIVANISLHVWPRIVALNEIEGSSASRMTSENRIVSGVKDLGAERFRDEKSTIMKYEVVLEGKGRIVVGDGSTLFEVITESGLEVLKEFGVVEVEGREGGDRGRRSRRRRWRGRRNRQRNRRRR